MCYYSTGFFYFMPKNRSQHMIQLAAICKSENIAKYSLDAVLRPLIDDIKKLVCNTRYSVSSVMSKNEGGIITIRGHYHLYFVFWLRKVAADFRWMVHQKNVYGTIAIGSADNPASSALGCFKEGFTAFRHCRQCMGTLEECKNEVSGTPSD